MVRYFVFVKPLAISAKDASLEMTAPVGYFSIYIENKRNRSTF